MILAVKVAWCHVTFCSYSHNLFQPLKLLVRANHALHALLLRKTGILQHGTIAKKAKCTTCGSFCLVSAPHLSVLSCLAACAVNLLRVVNN